MRAESMSSSERVECAISLEKPDRVPIWPDVTTSAAAGLTGQKNWEAAHKGFDAQQPRPVGVLVDYNVFIRNHISCIWDTPLVLHSVAPIHIHSVYTS